MRSEVRAKAVPLLQNLAVAVVVPVVILASVEILARCFLPDAPPNHFPGLSATEVADPDYLWRNRPGSPDMGTEGPINSLGFRGQEVPVQKPSGTFRILSLGESTSYGHGISWENTYARLIEKELGAEGYSVQVLNLAVRGWSTYQSVEFLSKEGDSLQPDLVLFYHEINDFFPTTFRGIELRGAGLTDEETVRRTKQTNVLERLVNHSKLYNFLRLSYARWRLRRAFHNGQPTWDALSTTRLPYDDLPDTAPGAPKPWMDNINPIVRVPDPQRLVALRMLIDWTRQHNVALVIMHPAYRISKRHECLLTKLAVEEHVPLLDVEDVLSVWTAQTGESKDALFRDRDLLHFNELGNRVLAQALLDFLTRERLLPMPRV